MRYILFFLTLLFLSVQVNAQSVEPNVDMLAELTPPKVVVDKFKEEFPSVTPKWSMEGVNYRADFVDPVSLMGLSIVYDKEGKVIRRESELDNGYPQGINQYFIKKYPGEKFKTWSSLDNNGKKRYYIKRDRGVVWFDHEGKFVEEKR